jgi:hypothetical protein
MNWTYHIVLFNNGSFIHTLAEHVHMELEQEIPVEQAPVDDPTNSEQAPMHPTKYFLTFIWITTLQ